MLLHDSFKISAYEGERLRFSKRDIGRSIRHFKSVDYRKPFNIGKTKVTFFDAGHIPGSAMILLETKKKRILYTGDFNLSDTRLIKGADTDIPDVDVLITESTYSDREHPNRQEEERKLIQAIKGSIANDGVALVSCFAIARTQEITLILDEYEIKDKVYIDGMSKKATRIIDSYPDLQREYNQLEKALKRLDIELISHPAKRNKIIKEPCIIVTTSGMLTGGPVAYYIEKLWDRKECSLILTGFQVPGTEGALLLKTGHYIHEDLDIPLKMNLRKFDFSSHASRSELFRLAKEINPEKIFCIHGDNTERYAKELRLNYGFDAVAPEDDRIFLLE